MARLQTEKGKLLIVDKPAHPDVIAIEREIAATQTVIERLRVSVNTQANDAHLPPGTPPATAEASQDDSSITQLKSQLEANRLEIENLMKYEEQKKIISEYQNRLNLTPVREQQLTSLLRDYELSKRTMPICWVKNSSRNWRRVWRSSREDSSSDWSNHPVCRPCLQVQSA